MLRTSEVGNAVLTLVRLARIKKVFVVLCVLLCAVSWHGFGQAHASHDSSNSDISFHLASSGSFSGSLAPLAQNASCHTSEDSARHCNLKYAYKSYKDDGYDGSTYERPDRYRQRYKQQRPRHEQGRYYGTMDQYELFKEGIVYAFQNIDIVLFFVALGYCWLFMSTGSIVMGAVLFGIGVYLGNRYIDTSLVHDPDILKAILLFSAGLIMLTSNELNEKLIPLMSVPIGIVCSLTFRANGPAEILGKDFVIGAVVGIFVIVLLANAIWSAFKDSWYVNVGRKTLGAFLLVAGVIVLGVGSNPPPV